MYRIADEDGQGVVSADGSDGVAARYHLDVRLKAGGFKVVVGWIEAPEAVLQALVPAAQVVLVTRDGVRWQIELTEVSGDRAYVRCVARLSG